MNRFRAAVYLYLPYLGIVAIVDIITSLLNYFVLSRFLDLPDGNTCIIIPSAIMIVVLLALYRPVVVRLNVRWHPGQCDMPKT